MAPEATITFILANFHFIEKHLTLSPPPHPQPSSCKSGLEKPKQSPRNTSEEKPLHPLPAPYVHRPVGAHHLPRKEKVNFQVNQSCSGPATFSDPSHSQRWFLQLKPDLCLLGAQTRVRGAQTGATHTYTSSPTQVRTPGQASCLSFGEAQAGRLLGSSRQEVSV